MRRLQLAATGGLLLRGRADEIGEHDGELTPFGVVPWLGSRGGKLRRDGHGSAGKLADGPSCQ